MPDANASAVVNGRLQAEKEAKEENFDETKLSQSKAPNFFNNKQVKSEYFMELNPLEKALKTHNIEGKRKMLK